MLLTSNIKTMLLFSVIPPKPANLLMINKTSDSATLCWESRHSMWSFPPGLTHKVMYRNHWDYEKGWKVGSILHYQRYFLSL